MGLRRGAAAWCCVGAQQRGAAQGRSVGQRLGCALRKGVVWGCAGAQRGATRGRSSVGLRRGAAAWGCAEQPCGAAQWWGGCVGAQRHGGALGRSARL